MLNKMVDEYQKLNRIVKTNDFCLIDTKELVTTVIKTTNNDYLRFYEVYMICFEYIDNSVYIHDVTNGYSEEINDEVIEKITIL